MVLFLLLKIFYSPSPLPLSSTSNGSATQKVNSDKNDAKWKAREFVGASLKAQSTATWPNYNEFAAAPESGEPGVWKVAGYVDSQNSFGAMLRNEFLVTMKKNGENWELIEVWFKKK